MIRQSAIAAVVVATALVAQILETSMPGFTATGVAYAAAAPSAQASQLPADPWPRDVSLSNAAVLVYQPQVNRWVDNQIDFRCALAIKPTGAKDESFGVIFATARTQVDKVARTVVFENLQITKSDFPTLPNHGAAYTAELQKEFAANVRSIALDRLQSSLALAGIKPPAVAVINAAPQVIISYSPAILVPIDGAPVLKPVPNDARFQRVINTRALILQGGLLQQYYMHVYDGWLSASTLAGPWSKAINTPIGMTGVADKIAKSGTVDMLDGGPKANPKPSLANGVPTVYTSQVPTELIVFRGQPDFVPVLGTQPSVGVQHDIRRAHRHEQQQLLHPARRPLVPVRRDHGALDLRSERRAARGFREDPCHVARRRGAAHRGRHTAGTGGRHREFDPADGDGPAQERPDVHAELRWPAAVLADPRHVDVVHRQCLGADHPGRAEFALCRDGWRLVHGARSSPDRGRSQRRCRPSSTRSRRRRRSIT